MKNIINHMMDWFEIYAKHRDVLTKSIDEITRDENFLTIKYKDKTQKIFFFPDLSNLNFNLLKDSDYPSLVVLNNDKNIDQLVKKWSSLIVYSKLKVYFINPFSDLEKKWILIPYTHHQISDIKHLKKGLESLSENVQRISPEDYMGRI